MSETPSSSSAEAVAPDVVPFQLGTFLHRAVRIIVPLRFWLHVRFWHLADINTASKNVRFWG